MVTDASGEYSRKIWLLETGYKEPRMLGIFLDGEFYVNHLNGPALLEQLQAAGTIPSMLCAFVSHVNGEARHRDLTCNPQYGDFIARGVVGWLCSKSGLDLKGGNLIAGASLGGLAATHVTLTYPTVFSRCLSQSASYWWNNEWLANDLASMPSNKGRFWISVGNKETASGVSHPPTGLRQDVSQISACERMAADLGGIGHSVHYSVYEGGHEFKPWAEEMGKALTWLFK